MQKVKPKKSLGQHFLNDENIALQIVNSLKEKDRYKQVLEIGPGMGVLTKYLLKEKEQELFVAEIDRDSIAYLKEYYPELKNNIIEGDFLTLPLAAIFKAPLAVIGNFPYNISSQILFRVLEHRDLVPEVVGMFQKEVAQRIASPPKNKSYGILSVLMQAFYNIEYLFTVHENVFTPPPKVKSAVIRLTRNNVKQLDCNEELFVKIIKTGFNQRRKTLRNALKPIVPDFSGFGHLGIFNKRAEELSVADYVALTNLIEKS